MLFLLLLGLDFRLFDSGNWLGRLGLLFLGAGLAADAGRRLPLVLGVHGDKRGLDALKAELFSLLSLLLLLRIIVIVV